MVTIKRNMKLGYALENNIGYFVKDSFEEIELMRPAMLRIRFQVVLRVNPGVEAHTHEFIPNGQEDSRSLDYQFNMACHKKQLTKCKQSKKVS